MTVYATMIKSYRQYNFKIIYKYMDSMWRGWHSLVIKCMCKWLKLDLYFSSDLETRIALVHAGDMRPILELWRP